MRDLAGVVVDQPPAPAALVRQALGGRAPAKRTRILPSRPPRARPSPVSVNCLAEQPRPARWPSSLPSRSASRRPGWSISSATLAYAIVRGARRRSRRRCRPGRVRSVSSGAVDVAGLDVEPRQPDRRSARRRPAPATSRSSIVISSYFPASTWVRNGNPPTLTSGGDELHACGRSAPGDLVARCAARRRWRRPGRRPTSSTPRSDQQHEQGDQQRADPSRRGAASGRTPRHASPSRSRRRALRASARSTGHAAYHPACRSRDTACRHEEEHAHHVRHRRGERERRRAGPACAGRSTSSAARRPSAGPPRRSWRRGRPARPRRPRPGRRSRRWSGVNGVRCSCRARRWRACRPSRRARRRWRRAAPAARSAATGTTVSISRATTSDTPVAVRQTMIAWVPTAPG